MRYKARYIVLAFGRFGYLALCLGLPNSPHFDVPVDQAIRCLISQHGMYRLSRKRDVSCQLGHGNEIFGCFLSVFLLIVEADNVLGELAVVVLVGLVQDQVDEIKPVVRKIKQTMNPNKLLSGN